MFQSVLSLQSAHWPGHQDFVKLINDASYHFADDTTREWSLGREKLRKAAEILVANGWRFWMIQRVWAEIKPLASFENLIDQWVLAAHQAGKDSM